MSEKNFKLTIQYLGTPYNGWQYQPNRPTVQGEIESAFIKILHKNKQNINLIGSGRTDSGVHAIGQIANIIINTDLSSNDLKNALNANLSNNIFIKSCEEVNLDFHSRFSAIKRSYFYKISQKYSPFLNNREWFNESSLDLDLLDYSAKSILGNHDFTLLSKFNPDLKNRECVIHESYWSFVDNKLIYNITSNRFLHHMVRYIVGTMIEVAKQNILMDNFLDLLNNRESGCPIFRAPSDGLYLNKVYYE